MPKILIAVVCGLAIFCVILLAMLIATRNAFVAYQQKAEQNPPKVVYAADVGYTSVIHGDLDRPIGEEVKIHGKAVSRMSVNFEVDSVNGRAVNGLQIHLVGASRLAEGTEATVRGKEKARIFLRYPGDFNSSPDDLSNKDRQIIVCAFMPLEVINPKGLALEDETGW